MGRGYLSCGRNSGRFGTFLSGNGPMDRASPTHELRPHRLVDGRTPPAAPGTHPAQEGVPPLGCRESPVRPGCVLDQHARDTDCDRRSAPHAREVPAPLGSVKACRAAPPARCAAGGLDRASEQPALATLRAWRLKSKAARLVRFGRAVRYLEADIVRYMVACAVEPRPDRRASMR